jgi:hypothetical protein
MMEDVLTAILSFKVGGDGTFDAPNYIQYFDKVSKCFEILQILSLGNSLSSIIHPLHSQVIKVNADFIPLCLKKIKSWLEITNLENDLSVKTNPYGTNFCNFVPTVECLF